MLNKIDPRKGKKNPYTERRIKRGERSGSLSVLRRTNEKYSDDQFLYECRCDCGRGVTLPGQVIRQQLKLSCGYCSSSVIDLPGEIWKSLDHLGFKNMAVSNLGRVKRVAGDIVYSDGKIVPMSERLINQRHNKWKYLEVRLRHATNRKLYYLTHRIVAMAFIPNPESKPFINHKDGIRDNNKLENLEWCTQSENVLHSYRMGFQIPPWRGKERNEMFKAVEQIDPDTGKVIAIFPSQKEAARQTNTRKNCISMVCSGSRTRAGGFFWRHAVGSV